MLQAMDKQIPSQYNYHNRYFMNSNGQTVEELLKINNINVPQEWICDQKILEQYKLFHDRNNIPYSQFIDRNYNQSKYGDTFAMFLSRNGIIPPQEFQHEQSLQNKYGDTVAMIMAYSKQIPPNNWHHDPNIKNAEGKTVEDQLKENEIPVPEEWKTYIIDITITDAMKQAQQGIIPKQRYHHDPALQNSQKQTVAMILASKGINPPNDWYHDPLLTNNQGETVAMLLARKGILPSQEWYHDPNKKNNFNHTVCYFLFNNEIWVPQQWQDYQYNNPDKDEKGNTKAMTQAQQGQIPDKDNYHNPGIQNKKLMTVAMLLIFNQKIPQAQWIHDPLIKNNQRRTAAMFFAIRNKVPPTQWRHDPYIKDKYGLKVQDYLQSNNIQIPDEWNCNGQLPFQVIQHIQRTINQTLESDDTNKVDDPNNTLTGSVLDINSTQITTGSIKPNLTNTRAMIQAIEGQIPDKENYHDPEEQNSRGQTVALILASQGIIPPPEWNHDSTIYDNSKFTVEQYLIKHHLPVPNHWMTNLIKKKNDQQFENAIYNQKIIGKINPDKQNSDGFTIAMIQAINNKVPEDRFYHDPDIKNKYGQTVEDILSWRGIDVPYEWKCRNNDEYSEDYNNPEKDMNNQTEAMRLVTRNKEPQRQHYHNPIIQDIKGNTVAMIYASKGKISPIEWYHKSELQNTHGSTVAIILAKQGIIPPKEWYHDPSIKDSKGKTVYDYLQENEIDDIPDKWKINKQQYVRIYQDFKNFCESHSQVKDNDYVKLRIKSSPNDVQEQNAKQFVRNIVQICYEDNKQYKCKFYVRQQLIQPLQQMIQQGIKDKNRKITRQIQILKQKQISNNQQQRYITCQVNIQKKDVLESINKFGILQYRVTCKFYTSQQQNNNRRIIIQLDSHEQVIKVYQWLCDRYNINLMVENNKITINNVTDEILRFVNNMKINGQKLTYSIQ